MSTNGASRALPGWSAHKAFLSDTSALKVEIVMSGPLLTEDGSPMIGSLFVVEAADLATVERFNAADPFHAARIWESAAITGFIRSQG